jgi:Arc/MetJ family transcription regulator
VKRKQVLKMLREHNKWMIEHLTLADKIGFISPVNIEIDDDFARWTLTMDNGAKAIGASLEEAVDIAVRYTNEEIDKEVLKARFAA